MWASNQPYPHHGHMIGSFSRSRLPSRGSHCLQFLLFTDLLEACCRTRRGSSISIIGLLHRASIECLRRRQLTRGLDDAPPIATFHNFSTFLSSQKWRQLTGKSPVTGSSSRDTTLQSLILVGLLFLCRRSHAFTMVFDETNGPICESQVGQL